MDIRYGGYRWQSWVMWASDMEVWMAKLGNVDIRYGGMDAVCWCAYRLQAPVTTQATLWSTATGVTGVCVCVSFPCRDAG